MVTMSEARLREKYPYIRRVFFPRWDRKGEWRIKLCDRIGMNGPGRTDGLCEHKSKTIFVSREHDPKELDLVLIHEIAHAVTRGGHGERWVARMEKAARRAEQIGRSELAEAIRREVAAPTLTEDDVYDEVREFVDSHPKESLKAAVSFVAFRYGRTDDEFLAWYPRLREVYEEVQGEH